MNITVQRAAILALLYAPLAATADQTIEPALAEVRAWSLSEGDLAVNPQPSQPSHRLRLDMAIVSGTRWDVQVILDAAKGAAAILAQCDIQVARLQLHEFSGPQRYRYFSTRDSREFARLAGLEKPTVFFIEDTVQRPAFDAEAIGRSNARSRPELADTVWITAAIRDLPIALAHELVHVLADSGDHSDAVDNLMREDTTPGNTHLTPGQCVRIVSNGKANGLLDGPLTRRGHP